MIETNITVTVYIFLDDGPLVYLSHFNMNILTIGLLIIGGVVHINALNYRPIIGILAQETEHSTHGKSYFFQSYAGFLQSAGARIVAIRIDQDESYYKSLLKNINGVLFPGGGVNITTSGYGRAGKIIFNIAKEANDAGDYFPLWGTCLGFEMLCQLAAEKEILSSCDAENLTLPLNFTSDATKSKLFSNLPTALRKYVAEESLTQNNHKECVDIKTYSRTPKLHEFYRVLSTNVDRKGQEFVSAIEGRKYPFYGVQFHPEKVLFNWDVNLAVSHAPHAISLTQYLANFFLSEVRKNEHHFSTLKEEADALIENITPTYLGLPRFYSAYYFSDGKMEDVESKQIAFDQQYYTVSIYIPSIHMKCFIIFIIILLIGIRFRSNKSSSVSTVKECCHEDKDDIKINLS